MVIPCIYRDVNANDNFYFCDDSNFITTVYNSRGLPIDSTYDAYPAGTGRVLFIAPFSIPERLKQIHAMANRRYWEWEDFTPSKAWIIDSMGTKTAINDTVTGVNNDKLWLRLKNNEKQGIYDVGSNSFVVPMTSDSIKIVTRKFMIVTGTDGCKAYTVDGKLYNVPREACNLENIYDDGAFFETGPLPGQAKTMYDNHGKMIMPADKGWRPIINDHNRIIGFYVQKRNTGKYSESDFEIYNTEGTLLKTVYHFEYAAGNCLLVSVYDSTNPGVPAKYLYDIVNNKWQLMDILRSSSQPSEKQHWEFVKKDNQYVTVHNPEGYTVYYSGSTGEQLYKVPDSEKRFFDPATNDIRKKYDSVVNLENFLSGFHLAKKGTKWALLNSNLHEIVPAEYDHIEFKNPIRYSYDKTELGWPPQYATVTRNNKTYRIDTSGRIMFGGKYFDGVSNYPVNGKWLAYSYKELTAVKDKGFKYTVIDTVFIIDSGGNVLATWKGSDSFRYDYRLTVNGKILRFKAAYGLSPSNIQLFDPLTNKTESLPYVVKDFETFQKGCLLILCKNDQGQLGLFSALDLSAVLPFGHYDPDIIVKEVVNTRSDKENGIMVRVTEKDDNEGPEGSHPNLRKPLAVYAGFYSVSGIKFWDN